MAPLRMAPLNGDPSVDVSVFADAGASAIWTTPRTLAIAPYLPGAGALYLGPLDGGPVSVVIVADGGVGGPTFDNSNIYWQDTAGIHATALDGGVTTLITSEGSLPADGGASLATLAWNGFVLDDYYGGTISLVPFDGGSPVTLASGQTGPLFVRPCGQDLCWISSDGGVTNGVSASTLLVRMSPGGVPQILNPSVPALL
ncbi:MAG: hypothetical protein ABSC94_20225 [Polyangiaceae bacterium]